jgi:energy-coupling factor transporter ATP-binding protein EcfA2
MRRARRGSTASRLAALFTVTLVSAAAVLEGWQQPPAWLFPERRVDVQTLHWLHIHLLSTAGITAIATVAAALIALFIGLRDRRSREGSGRQQARERSTVLRRVRRRWVKGLLEPSLANIPELALSLRMRPDVLCAPASPAPGHSPQSQVVPEEKTILDVFDEASGSLLILGTSGAGKTTLLLQLATALIDRAENDPSQPIPVVLNLETWTGSNRALVPWLLEELNSNYRVPGPTANDWIASGELVLLLDGLDQISLDSQAACVAAINEYREDHGLSSLVVCCRTPQLQEIPVILQMEDAVELQPLTDEQISEFFDRLDKPGNQLLNAVRDAIRGDDDLKILLRTPLMMNVISIASAKPDFAGPPAPGTAKEWEAALWQAYVERMFEQRPLPRRCRYEYQQAVRWLEWLASELRARGRSEFYLDRLNPSWLYATNLPRKPGSQRRRKLDFIEFLNHPLTYREIMFSDPFVEDLYSPEALAFDSQISGALTLVETVITTAAASGLVGGFTQGMANGPASGALAGLLSALAGGVGAFLLSWVLIIFTVPAIPALFFCDGIPGGGIRAATILAAWAGFLPAMIFGIVAGFGYGDAFGTATGISMGVGFGLWFGIRWAMKNGAYRLARNYAARILLAHNDCAPQPWRHRDFLEAMTERQLLHRSGRSYIFIHQTLRDYFAGHHPRPPFTGVITIPSSDGSVHSMQIKFDEDDGFVPVESENK